MGRRITSGERRQIIDLWLSGKNIREIHAITKRGSGSISNIVNEEKEKVPDLERLRELNLDLKEAGVNLLVARRGAIFIEKLHELNISTDTLPQCTRLLDEYGEEAGDVLEWGLRLRELESSQGKTYEQIIVEATEKVRNAQKWERYVNQLREQEKNLKNSIRELKPLTELQGKLNYHNLTPNRLDGFIEKHLRLEELGFTLETAEILASNLKGIGIDPEKASERLTSLLSRHESLKRAVTELSEETQRIEKTLKQNQIEVSRNIKLIKASEDKIAKLEAKIEEKRKEHEAILDQIEEKRIELDDTRAGLREAETAFIELQKKLTKIWRSTTLLSLITTPKVQIKLQPLLYITRGVVDAFRKHLVAHQSTFEVLLHKTAIGDRDPTRGFRWDPYQPQKRTTLDLQTLKKYLEEIEYTLGEGYRLAARKTI